MELECGVESDRVRTNVKNAELTAPELAQLGEFLSQVKNPHALSLEGMDGLFCALVAGPEWVTAGEFLPLLWGGPLPDDIVMFDLTQVNAMALLLMRHWNSIQAQLQRGAVHPPLIVRGVTDAVPGRAWARGFMRGVNFSQAAWNELFQDEASDEFHRIAQLADENDPQGRSGRHFTPGQEDAGTHAPRRVLLGRETGPLPAAGGRTGPVGRRVVRGLSMQSLS